MTALRQPPRPSPPSRSRPIHLPCSRPSIQAAKTASRKAARDSTYKRGIVRKIDLTGDGRDDYLVDFRAGFCAERLYMFNGTGGWDLDIFVARGGGAESTGGGRGRGGGGEGGVSSRADAGAAPSPPLLRAG